MDRKNAVSCIKRAAIRRKEVPVREMLERIQRVGFEDEVKRRDRARHDSGVDIGDDIEKAGGLQELDGHAVVIAELE